MNIKTISLIALCAASLALTACGTEDDSFGSLNNNENSQSQVKPDPADPANPDPDSTTNPDSTTPDAGPASALAPLCAIPALGPAIVEGAGGVCGEGSAGTGAGGIPGADQLTALCAVPTIGPALVEGAGQTCDEGAGGESPLPLDQLCAIPALGPALVEGAGGSCPPGDTGGDAGAGGTDALCMIPVLGPAFYEGAGLGTCPAGGGVGVPAIPGVDQLPVEQLSLLCQIPVLGPILVDNVLGALLPLKCEG